MAVFAPYNFVPVNEKVWFPTWGAQVSHDIPFEDGVSGVIYYTLKNESPMIIGGEKDHDNVIHFFKDRTGKPSIPGSSIRGVIRNIHEILSFSKIRTDMDLRLSIRDPYLKEYREVVHMNTIEGRIQYGWLRKRNKKVEVCFVDGRKAKYGERANVVTGGGKVPNPIKKYFVFPQPGDNWEEVTKAEMKRFELAHRYSDGEFFENYLRTINKIDNNKVAPIFVITYEKKRYFGVCKYMRIPYARTVGQTLPESHKSSKSDLTELIFGYTNDEDALKSRVMFSHLRLKGESLFGEAVEAVLASPKPSYYPTYIEQAGHPGNTLFSYNTAEIRGFKRYPIHKTVKPDRARHTIPQGGNAQENEDIRLKFKPLKIGHTFSGKVMFYNLLPVELGSVLSALTFQGQQDILFHNIGMAKPLGYGKCKIKIDFEKSFFRKNDSFDNNLPINMDAFLDEYRKVLASKVGEKNVDDRWEELFEMAKEYNFLPSSKTYMTVNEHRNAKRNKQYLKPYSQINKS